MDADRREEAAVGLGKFDGLGARGRRGADGDDLHDAGADVLGSARLPGRRRAACRSRCACVSTSGETGCDGAVHDLAAPRREVERRLAGPPRARSRRVVSASLGVGLLLVPDQFQSISGHLETLATQVFMQAGVELGDQIGVEAGGQVVNGSGSEATKMVMQVAACVVPGAVAAGSARSAWSPLRRRPRLRGLYKRSPG